MARCGVLAVPRRERAAVVAVGAVHPERLRHVHHQRVGPLGLLDRLAVARRAVPSSTPRGSSLPWSRNGVNGSYGSDVKTDLRRRVFWPAWLPAHALGGARSGILEPDIRRHRLPRWQVKQVTPVFATWLFQSAVDVPGHLRACAARRPWCTARRRRGPAPAWQ